MCECVNDGWCADAWMGRCGWIGVWMDEWVCECIHDGWCVGACMHGCGWIGVDGQVCGWTNGCVNVYMMVGVWMHACMDGCGWMGV